MQTDTTPRPSELTHLTRSENTADGRNLIKIRMKMGTIGLIRLRAEAGTFDTSSRNQQHSPAERECKSHVRTKYCTSLSGIYALPGLFLSALMPQRFLFRPDMQNRAMHGLWRRRHGQDLSSTETFQSQKQAQDTMWGKSMSDWRSNAMFAEAARPVCGQATPGPCLAGKKMLR